MPATNPLSTILVTGASGFTGSWIVRALLDNGYSVRGTVRSKEKGEYLKKLFNSCSFTPVVVADISTPGALDQAVQAVEGVVHIAGNPNLASSSSESSGFEVVNTGGVKALLNSLLEHGQNVRRLVYMSSAMALLGKSLTHIYTEDDWNDTAVKHVREKGSEADQTSQYAASKVLAERAIVDFIDKHRGEINWDATRMAPVWIYGPIIHECKSIKDLNFSTGLMYHHATTPHDKANVNDYVSDFIDVRDVADAFVEALKIESAGGERFILDAGAFTYQNLYDAIHSESPDMPEVPVGDPAAPKFSFPGPFCNSGKAMRVLALKDFRDLAECARDTLTSIKSLV